MNRTILSLLLIPLMISGCGGGQSTADVDDNTMVVQPPPVQAPPVAASEVTVKTGIISGFGSIYIDGKRYLTDNANIIVNGAPGQTIDRLKVGMRIQLKTEDDNVATPHASEVIYETEIEGTVLTIDRNNKVISVAGIDIIYDDVTHFIGISEASLAVGNRIEVSGRVLSNGRFSASLVKLENDGGTNQVSLISGIISSHNQAAKTFNMGDLTINYANAQIDGAINLAEKVKIKGQLNGSIFVASEIDVESIGNTEHDNDDLYAYEIDGVITAYDNATRSISINGESFQLSQNARFENGQEADLSVGAPVELKLIFTNGTPQIVRVEFERTNAIDGKVKGAIAAIDFTARTLEINGISYTATALTRYENDDYQYISFNSLQINDFVELVYKSDGMQNSILRIELENEQERFEDSEIKGLITSVNELQIIIAGITIDFPSRALYLVRDMPVSLSDFIDALTSTSVVEVEGTFNATNQFVPTKFEIEIRDDEEQHHDNRDAEGYVEIEGRVTEILSATSFRVNGYVADLSQAIDLELNDRQVTISQFMAAVAIGTVVEVEGYRSSQSVITVFEAEIDND